MLVWRANDLSLSLPSPIDRDAPGGKAGLFQDLAEPSKAQVDLAKSQATIKRRQGAPRLQAANGLQVKLRPPDLESRLDAFKARGGNAGRAPIDPQILFARWLYVTLDGVGSGREVAPVCRANMTPLD